MNNPFIPQPGARHPRWRAVAAAAALAASSGAQAVVGAPAIVGPSGDMQDIAYGSGGNVYQLLPWLYVQGLGNAGTPSSIVVLNPDLQFSFAVGGVGTNLLTIDYRIRNVSATDSFQQLRLMVFSNPDGDSTQYLDRMSAVWGPALPGGPVLHEVRAFSNDPFETIPSRFRLNNTLTEGANPVDAACAAASGCDATVGMQWNAPLLGPGESFLVRVGLSDNGQSLSSRRIVADALNSPATTLTLSGLSQVIPVPEPSTLAMLLAGVGVLAHLSRRRRRD
ncbi:MAG: PEP-CTERM sorting domain-containing protein [Rubrivivax sp.]